MSRALLKFVRVSPTKARLIAREVQGMNGELALAALEFMPNKAAGIISKVIASAIANGDYEPEEIVITTCRVDKAAVMKRWRPRARGTASRIIKPTAHILVEVATASSSASEDETNQKKGSAKNSVKKAPKKAIDKKVANTKSEKQKDMVKTPNKSEAKGDDLTELVGVGKAYKEKLNSEGIYTFADVANMSQTQIDTMEEKYSFKGDFMDTIADAKKLVEKEA